MGLQVGKPTASLGRLVWDFVNVLPLGPEFTGLCIAVLSIMQTSKLCCPNICAVLIYIIS